MIDGDMRNRVRAIENILAVLPKSERPSMEAKLDLFSTDLLVFVSHIVWQEKVDVVVKGVNDE